MYKSVMKTSIYQSVVLAVLADNTSIKLNLLSVWCTYQLVSWSNVRMNGHNSKIVKKHSTYFVPVCMLLKKQNATKNSALLVSSKSARVIGVKKFARTIFLKIVSRIIV